MDNDGGNGAVVFWDDVEFYEIENETVLTGLDGYASVCDTSSGDTSNTTKAVEESVETDTCVFSDGSSNYYHLRSVDYGGNWDSTSADAGPYWICVDSVYFFVNLTI